MLTRDEAIQMAADSLNAGEIPDTSVNISHSLKDLLPVATAPQSEENRTRQAIVYRENGLSKFVIQSRIRRWRVNDRVIRAETPLVIWAERATDSLFPHVSAYEPSHFQQTPLLRQSSVAYPFTEVLVNTLGHRTGGSGLIGLAWNRLFPTDVQRLFHPSVLTEAALPFERRRVVARNAAAKELRRAIFKLSERKAEYVAAVKILGRRPTYNEVTVIQLMWPAIEPLLDTPIVIEPALRFHMHDIIKRLKPWTAMKAVERAAAVTSAQVTQFAKREVDPHDVLLARQWRWLMRQKAIAIRQMPPMSGLPKFWQFALHAEFFPDLRTYRHILHPFRLELARIIREFGCGSTTALPEIVSVFLRAIKRHADGNKNHEAAYANPHEQVKILRALADAHHDILMDTELRQANLGTLYELARDMRVISMEPEASLEFDRQAFDFPLGGKNIVFEDHEFVPLRDHVMVYEEGQRLNHCLFRGHMRAMMAGSFRAYAVIDLVAEKPVGTLLLNRRARYEKGSFSFSMSQFAGFNNKDLSYSGHRALVDAFVKHVNAGGEA